jgi:hypothetical protein
VRTRSLSLLIALLALVGLAAACGDDDDGTVAGDDDTETTAPEDVKAPDAEVATGLGELQDLADEVVAAVQADDTDKATAEYEEAHEVWEGIEGTIKDNDEDAYIAFEDALASLESAAADGDLDKATAAAEDIKTAAAAYLEAHPG